MVPRACVPRARDSTTTRAMEAARRADEACALTPEEGARGRGWVSEEDDDDDDGGARIDRSISRAKANGLGKIRGRAIDGRASG